MRTRGRAWVRAMAIALLAIGGSAGAQSLRDQSGDAVAALESRGEVDGFSAMVLVTSDPDWMAKWDTPPDVIPHFNEASEVARGDLLAILVFFANPSIVDGAMDTVVSLKVTQPDGSLQIDAPDSRCYSGPFGGDPRNVMLCETLLGYSADPEDLSGLWIVDAVVKDRHRQVEVPLRASFRVLD